MWDRGFTFGDSVYEVFRMYDGRRWLEAEHLARLKRSLNELELPPHDLERLVDRMDCTTAASGIKEGTTYVQVTRGVCARAHAFPDPPVPPTEVIVIRPYDDGPAARLRQAGARLISQPDLRWKRCDIKSTNLLANVLASEAARRAGCHEAVFYDSDGYVTEATHSSLLWLRHGRLEGTPEGHEILPGLTRGLVLRLIEPLQIPFAGTRITLPALVAAEEVILVGTTYEVLPVVEIDGQKIGTGVPGPLARRLGEVYRHEVSRWIAGRSSPSEPEPGRAREREAAAEPAVPMTKSEVIDDPFSAHLKRDPLPGAGIRIVLLTRLPHDQARAVIAPLEEGIAELKRPVEQRIVDVTECGLAEGLRRGLEDAHLPLVLLTTAIEPWTTNHLAPLLKAIDQSDHVIGRRPRPARSGGTTLRERLVTRLIFALPLDDVHSPCRLHRLEKLAAIVLQSRSSFLDTEILAKATFLGHLIDEVRVPPLPSEAWYEGWWSDWNRLFKHPEFKAPSRPETGGTGSASVGLASRPSEVPEGECEAGGTGSASVGLASRPPEVAEGECEGDDRPCGEDQQRVADLEQPGPAQNDPPQSSHELSQRQRR